MKDIYEMLEKGLGLNTEELDERLEAYGITFRGSIIYVRTWKDNKIQVTVEDVIRYYRYEAGNLTSGCRTLAELSGDWRPIDNLAKSCLEIYKVIKKPELKKIAHKNGMELKD
jgi:hypothetical protein